MQNAILFDSTRPLAVPTFGSDLFDATEPDPTMHGFAARDLANAREYAAKCLRAEARHDAAAERAFDHGHRDGMHNRPCTPAALCRTGRGRDGGAIRFRLVGWSRNRRRSTGRHGGGRGEHGSG